MAALAASTLSSSSAHLARVVGVKLCRTVAGGVDARRAWVEAKQTTETFTLGAHAHGVVCVQWYNVRTLHRAAGMYSGRKRLPGADALSAAFKSFAGAQRAPAAKV
jgi:hypothetical protein